MPRCSKCPKKAVVGLGYCGLDLCKDCFAEFFEKRVWKANKDFLMLRRGDKVAVGISGGKDSAAMLHVLNKMAKKIGQIQLFPILVDEGVHGYRPNSIKKAKELCKREGFGLDVVSFEREFGATLDAMVKKRGQGDDEFASGACSICGVFRKKALEARAKKLGATKLAVGHNADDSAQTFLMNLMRNDSARLVRVSPAHAEGGLGLVPRIKPLVYNLERECGLYCVVENLPFHLQECPYAKESFRGTVKDFLNLAEEKHPGVKFNVLQSSLLLQKTLAEISPRALREGGSKKCKICGSPSSSGVCKACEYAKRLQLE